jgi:hypothetical protein
MNSTVVSCTALAALRAAIAHSPIITTRTDAWEAPRSADREVLRWIASHVKPKKPLGLC